MLPGKDGKRLGVKGGGGERLGRGKGEGFIWGEGGMWGGGRFKITKLSTTI